jgi:hypothetical protein
VSGYREIEEFVRAYDKKLLATDPRFRKSVALIHEEGTTLFFNYAFLMKKEDWIIAFTEHHKYHIYHKDDLIWYGEFKREYSELEELK